MLKSFQEAGLRAKGFQEAGLRAKGVGVTVRTDIKKGTFLKGNGVFR
jgi:hypothetical protein